MDNTSTALAHIGLLNKQFSDALSPINNYASINVQQGVARQQAELAQQLEFQKMAFAQKLAQANQVAQFEHAKALAKITEDRSMDLAKLQHQFLREDQVKAQADAIRNDEKARRLVGTEIRNFKDTPEGNAALVEAYTKTTSDPRALEKLHVEDAVAVSKTIKDTLSRLSSNLTGSPQSKQAVQRFLAQPGVVDLLQKKGDLTAQDVSKLGQSGDPQQVVRVIDDVAKKATWLYGRDDKVLAQLTGAWTTALSESGAAPTPDQMVNVDYLKDLMLRRADSLKNIHSEEGFKAIDMANGYAAPATPKLPPPMNGPTGVVPTVSPGVAAAQSVNPFVAPPVPVSDKTGLARGVETMLQPAAEPRAVFENAFAPEKFAKDPYTEYQIRQDLLNRQRTHDAFAQGLTSAIPFVPTYQPESTAFTQIQDEKKLQDFVKGLYSPRK